jgi:hypothetical protein
MSPDSPPTGSLIGACGVGGLGSSSSSSSASTSSSSCVYSKVLSNNLPPQGEMICTSVLILGSANCTLEGI